MTSDENLTRIREEIHGALKDSLSSFADEAELENTSERHDALLTGKLQSALDVGKKAVDVLSVFWKNSILFSESPLPDYVWISIFPVDSQGQRE
jgi:hypothetical protein